MRDNEITIQGGVFSGPVRLTGLLARRMNILFGRNGSGKSTIARAFRELQQQVQQPRYSLTLNGRELSGGIFKNLFVFNEDFVDANVKIAGKGLKAIVRIGTRAQQDGRIEALNQEISELRGDLRPCQAELSILGGKGDGSIDDAKNKLSKALKAPQGYLDRYSRIRGKQSNLTSALMEQVADPRDAASPGFSISAATAALDADITRYLSYQAGSEILWRTPSPDPGIDLDRINALLSTAVRPAQLNDVERAIIDDLSSDDFNYFVSKGSSILIEDGFPYCPLCHQPVTEEHRHSLEQSLIRFRGREAENHKAEVLRAAESIEPFGFALPVFPNDDYQADIAAAQGGGDALGAFIESVRESLYKKEENPYSALPPFAKGDLENLVQAASEAFGKVSEDVSEYNATLSEKEKLLEKINADNVTLAIHECQKWRDDYIYKIQRKDDLETEVAAIKDQIEKKESALSSLLGEQDEVEKAREQINLYLRLIFGERKLRLELDGPDSYKLQFHQDGSYIDIPPRAVSSGERNALALAYFFACVMENKAADYNYTDPTLLVIDDPVSSFDSENRAGVISLVLDQCRKVLDGNPESKLLVMTHDLPTLKDLCDWRSRNLKEEDDKYLKLGQNHRITEHSSIVILENAVYLEELLDIYRFAADDNPEDPKYRAIGNTIRRFAESYATRLYKCEWKSLFADDDHLSLVPRSHRDTLKSFAIRNVLNAESHGVIDIYEPVEIQRSARALLSYMYWSSGEHLKAYLNTDRFYTVGKWAEEM